MALMKLGNHLDANGYEIRNILVEVVGTLPTPTTAMEGRIVWLSTTDRFYACNGSAWVNPATDSDALAGQTSAWHRDRTNHTGSQAASTISDLAAVVKAYRHDEFAAPTADVSWGSRKLTNLANGTANNDAVNKSQLDAVSAVANSAALGVSIKEPVRVVSKTNITLSGTQTIDGVALAAGNRVLVAGQTTAANNGIYVVAAGAWARATDMDATGEVKPGTMVAVTEGTTDADSIWILTSDAAVTIGTTAQTWTKFISGGGTTYTAGNGITISTGVISVQAHTGISVTGSGVAIDTAVVARKVVMDVPSGSAETSISHNLNNQYPQWQVYEVSTNIPVLVPFTPSGVNGGTLSFASAPSTNQYKVIFIG
ncbi:hypothetical protein SEA_JONJAMES_58 [Gordonia Phage JonJames]|nr:hypothetical protein SEA_JONJAMES_58 [Gordonia Phage JonJames]